MGRFGVEKERVATVVGIITHEVSLVKENITPDVNYFSGVFPGV